MEKITINNLKIADLEQAIKNAVQKSIKEFSLQSLKPKPRGLDLVSREDTAKMLCVSLPTLHQWTKIGIIKANRIGNRVLYKLDDITNALNEIETSSKKGGSSC